MPNLEFDKQIIPDLTDRVVLITGGTSGIGAELVVELSKHNPKLLIFTGRNASSAAKTIQRAKSTAPNIAITFIPCDLASLSSVTTAATQILSQCPGRLDLFLANAGIMAKPPALSEDGYELHFATNHLGHALLTQKLLPLLEETAEIPGADVRVIFTTSTAWRGGDIPFDGLKTTMDTWPMGRWFRYSHSKLANLLYARELARRYPKLLSFSLTPGVVGTTLVSDLKLADRVLVYVSQLGKILTPEEGSYNGLWAVSAPRGSVEPGAFYEPVGQLSRMENAKSRDSELGLRLWEWTERELEKWMK